MPESVDLRQSAPKLALPGHSAPQLCAGHSGLEAVSFWANSGQYHVYSTISNVPWKMNSLTPKPILVAPPEKGLPRCAHTSTVPSKASCCRLMPGSNRASARTSKRFARVRVLLLSQGWTAQPVEGFPYHEGDRGPFERILAVVPGPQSWIAHYFPASIPRLLHLKHFAPVFCADNSVKCGTTHASLTKRF